VKKEHFNQLVEDYSKVDSHFGELEKLMVKYPYSQPVRMLNVKSCSTLDVKKYKQRLALAAFYTSDRNVLRSLIEKGKVPSDFLKKDHRTRPGIEAKIKKATSTSQPRILANKKIDAEQLRKEVLANLELLQKNKSLFLNLDDIKFSPKKTSKGLVKKKTAATVKKKQGKSKEIVKKASVKKTPQENKKELIDKFIADEPRITPKKILDENQSDLSKASSELMEDLVSENLAVIFANQGKNIKAIEIYKKLIWKFPQKKASFAAQIEKLKKN